MGSAETLIISCGITIAFCMVLKVYLKLTTGIYSSRKSMEGKTVIVTGANSGIGLETARDLAGRKARVILACRDLVKGRKAMEDIKSSTRNMDVTLKHLDLASLSSIRKFARDVIDNERELHVLVNNAGVTPPPGKYLTEDNLELQFATNHFGPFLLTNLLLPLLKKSAPSRIIMVSSVTHLWAKLDLDNLNCEKGERDPYWIYCSTKLANILFTRELNKKLAGSGVTVNALHPGAVKTSIAQNARWFIKYLIVPILYPFFKSCEDGSQTSIYLAVSEEVESVSGQYFSDCRPTWISPTAKDDSKAEKLWEISERLTGMAI